VKIPKKIKIGGFTWQIITDDQAVPYESNAYGSTHFKSQKIFLIQRTLMIKINKLLFTK